ncbi:unnamed protein product [Rhodiola kirilowii]
MDVSMSLQENLDIFLKLTQDLKKCEDEIKEEHLCVILLNSIPSQFDTLRDVIMYGNEEVTVSKIIGAITSKNDSLKVFKTKNGVKTENKSEVMMVKGKNKFKQKNKNHNHGSQGTFNNDSNKSQNNRNPEKSQGNSHRNGPVKCLYCGKLGHYANNCFKKQDDTKNSNNNKSQRENQSGFTNICEKGPEYNHEALVVSSRDDSSSWILDSGCTLHATPHKHLFGNLELCNGGEVMLGDHTSLKIKGIGSVPLRMFDGVIRSIQNVRWVPHLRRNLLSESALDKIGCKITTYKGIREVSRDGRVVIKSVEKGGLYYVVTSPEINISDDKSSPTLENTKKWHSRLGHIGNKGLTYLSKSGLIDCKPTDLKFCETCVFGKKSAHPFNKSTFTVNKPLEYVHSDLWGPSQVPTVGGRSYFISIID